MYLTGIQNIRDVLPFPRTPRNCECYKKNRIKEDNKKMKFRFILNYIKY